MDFALICTVAFGASLLTFFTGFGLGTLLLPAFAVFFPTEVAVALTAVVHLLNGLFKLALLRRWVNVGIAARFGIPAILAAYGGASLLLLLVGLDPLFEYRLGGRVLSVMPVSFVIAVLMVVFASLELWPGLKRAAFPARFLPLGGLLTGFFGGLSGHQGALRSAFLIRAGLGKESFIATGVTVAACVDVTRLFVYRERFAGGNLADNGWLLVAAALAAFSGALLGRKLLHKIGLRSIEVGVAVLLLLVALGLGSGILGSPGAR